MSLMLEQFHWLRPEWLLGILPALAFSLLLWQRKRQSSSWRTVIDPDLLPHLIDGQQTPLQRRGYGALFAAWCVACLALAGPTWEKLPQPVHKNESALVILLDLSPSMLAEDLKPSRLVRTRHKLIDLLQARDEGLTALIAYAGEAHVVSPLTDDTGTIESLLPALHPGVMPLRGSNPEMAVEKALELFQAAGIARGEILLVTDGIDTSATETLIDTLQDSNHRLSMLGVGTDDGAPIPTAQGGFVKDRQGGIVIASLNSHQLRQLAGELNSRFTLMQTDDRDIDWLSGNLSLDADPLLSGQTRQLEREFDTWQEYGHWLALLLLPGILFCFRRGVILTVALPLALILPEHSHAASWDDLWLTGDQQGQKQLQAGDAKAAAEHFTSQDWKGAAQYRAGDYEAAAESFAQGTGATDHYNRGNALARSGKLDEALQAYEQALALDPELEDARFNHKLIEDLKNQQQNSDNQNQQDQNQQGDGQNQQNQNQGEQNSQDGNQSPSSQQDSESQSNSESQQNPGDSSQQNENSPSNSQQQQSQTGEQSQDQQEAGDSGQQPEPREQQAEQGEQQSPQPQPGESEQAEQGEQPVAAQESDLSPEEQQAMEQWLRQIPDDPSGLLRRKFKHQYDQRRKEYRAGTWEPPANNANERW